MAQVVDAADQGFAVLLILRSPRQNPPATKGSSLADHLRLGEWRAESFSPGECYRFITN